MVLRTISARLVGALVVVLLYDSSVHAARLLKFTITVDGKTWKTGIHSDDGLGDAAAVWSYLREVHFQNEPGQKDTEKRENPLQTRLKGEIRLRAEHAGRVIAEASLTELLLVRTDASKDEWLLPPEEITRTALAAGLSAPLPDEGRLYWDVFLWGLIALFLGLIIFKLMRGSQPAEPVGDSSP